MKALQPSQNAEPIAAASLSNTKNVEREPCLESHLFASYIDNERAAALLPSHSSVDNANALSESMSDDQAPISNSNLARSESLTDDNETSPTLAPCPPLQPLQVVTQISVRAPKSQPRSRTEENLASANLADSYRDTADALVSISPQSTVDAGMLNTFECTKPHENFGNSLSEDIKVCSDATPGDSPKQHSMKLSTNSPKISAHNRRRSDGSIRGLDDIPHHAKSSSVQPKTLIGYGRHLMGLDFGQEPSPDSTVIEDAWSVATKRRGVYNLFQVPTRIERLLCYGQLICLDEFLSVFTIMPLRVFLALIRLVFFFICWPGRFLLRKRLRKNPDIDAVRRAALVGHVIDILHISLLGFTVMTLRMFDISWLYHNIRGQSVIKLYVVFNAMEIFDRLFSSFGVDILDSLGWTTASAVRFFSRVTPGIGEVASSSRDANRARALQGAALLTRMTFDYLCTLIYVILHSSLLLTWVVTLNVAINTQNNALLTLLISNNFVELKGSVFKTVKVQNLFQISCADAVERFQLTVFLGVMLVVTTADQHLFTTWIIIYGYEIFVDWIKHAFVTKFNRISPRVYHQFSLVICDDMSKTRKYFVVRNIGGSAVSKRIGFVSLPLASLVIRMTMSQVSSLPIPALGILFMALTMFKIALGIGLTGHSHRKVKRAAQESPVDLTAELDRDHDMYWRQKLLSVERYDIISKDMK